MRVTLPSSLWQDRACAGLQGGIPPPSQQLATCLLEASGGSKATRVALTAALLSHLLRLRCDPLQALPFPVQEALLQGKPLHPPSARVSQASSSSKGASLMLTTACCAVLPCRPGPSPSRKPYCKVRQLFQHQHE